MSLLINQTLMSDSNDLARIEKTNHFEAFEYLPTAKNNAYQDLLEPNETPLFLSVKLTAYNGEARETALIDSQSYLPLIVCTNRVLRAYRNIKILSLSFQPSLNRIKKEGLMINALLVVDNGRIVDSTLTEITNKLAAELKLDSSQQSQVSTKEEQEESKPVKQQVFQQKPEKTEEAKPQEAISKPVMTSAETKTEETAEKPEVKHDIQKEMAQNVETKAEEPAKKIEPTKTESAPSKSASPVTRAALNNFFNRRKKAEEPTTIIPEQSTIPTANATSIAESDTEQTVEKTEEPKVENSNLTVDTDKLNGENPVNKLNESSQPEEDKVEAEENVDIETEQTSEHGAEESTESKTETDAEAENSETTKDEAKTANESTENVNTEPKQDTTQVDNANTTEEQFKQEKTNEDASLENNPIVGTGSDYEPTTPEVSNVMADWLDYKRKKVDIEEINAKYFSATHDKPFLNSIETYVPSYDIETLSGDWPIYDIHEEDDFVETTASKEKIRATFNRVMNFFTTSERTSLRRTLNGEIEVSQFMYDVNQYVDTYCQIPEEDKKMFSAKLERSFFSYYVLTPAIMDENISDIRVLAPDNINVKVHGDHYTASHLKFIDANDYVRFIEGLIIRNRVNIGDKEILLFTDKDYNPDYILRFNICLGTINSTGLPYIHIRKVPKKKTTLTDLINAGMLDNKIAAYFLDKVATSKGIVFAGPSASGKTTLMNAGIDYIPKDKSVLCIQESEELFSHVHPNIYFQHMIKYADGSTKIGLSELGQNGLVCDSGYFIIGESKGKEVRDLLRASNTGHRCWTSVHAQSSEETITRLADYVKYGADYSFKEAERMLKDLEVIIYIQNFKVMEITEIVGYDDEKQQMIYRPIYRRNA